jgi:hypothetical protein
VQNYCGVSIGSTSIEMKYQEAILQLTIAKVSKDMISYGADANNPECVYNQDSMMEVVMVYINSNNLDGSSEIERDWINLLTNSSNMKAHMLNSVRDQALKKAYKLLWKAGWDSEMQMNYNFEDSLSISMREYIKKLEEEKAEQDLLNEQQAQMVQQQSQQFDKLTQQNAQQSQQIELLKAEL